MDRVYSRAPPSSSRGSTGPTRGKPPWEGRWGRLREDDGGEGQRRSEADELTNPTPDARGAGRETAGRSGDSHAMPRVCWAMGPLGTALRRRARGAEARRIPDMVWLRRIVPASVTQGGRSTRVQEDSRTQEFRVQSLDCSTPLRLSRCQIIAGDRIIHTGKFRCQGAGRQSCWSRLSSTHPAIRSDLD